MILSIALKEFYNNLLTARFTIGFLLCLVLVPFTLLVSINDFQGQLREYESQKKQSEESLKVRVYSKLRPEVVRPPQALSIFSKGVSYNVGSKVKILLGEKPMLSTGGGLVRENPFFNSFFSLDFTTILAIILSLLALLFTYDSCTGEREQGTLRLVFSNSLGRARFLLGKVIGVCLTLLPITLFCYLLAALVILFSPHVSFSAREWVGISALFGVSIIFFGLFMMIGLFISSRVRSSVTSIIVCLFVWVMFLFILPNLSTYAARSFVKANSRESLDLALQEIESEFNGKCEEYKKSLEEPPYGTWHWNYSGDEYGGYETAGSPDLMMEYHWQSNQFTEPLRIDYADRKWALQKAYLDELDRQRNFAERLSLLSPSEIFRLAVSALCRTDVAAHYRFLDRTREYREEFISFFENKKIFESYEYFTRQPPETFMALDEMIRVRTGGQFTTLQEFGEWAQAHNGDFSPLFKVNIPGTRNEDYEPLDLSDMPKFTLQETSIAGTLRNSLVKIGVLMLAAVLLFFLSFVSFTRYDVR
jgi:ABC-type transport system involved in multi-copper enzyme maturation permease subunit